MKSRIQLIGLPHRVNVKRYADSDDGAGGITRGTETSVYSDLKSRVASMSDEDEQKGFGNITGRRWKILTKYAPDIQRSDIVSLSASSKTAPISTSLELRVLYVKQQIDDKGGFHHTSLVCEEEESDA